MQVNGNSTRRKLSRNSGQIPEVLHVRVGELRPLVGKWRDENQRVPWSCLLEDALKLALAKYAGKRYAHLVEEEDAA